MHKIWKRFTLKEDPSVYQDKDSHLMQVLTVKDFLALGVGTIVSTSIFTLPGVVAARYAGPAVAISEILAAVVAGFVALAYAEMASAMPFAGWSLLAEYFIAVAFVASGLSANFRGLIQPLFSLPPQLSNAFGVKGGMFDLVAALVIIMIAYLLSRGVSEAARIQNILVVLKVIAIFIFILVGITALHPENYLPFIPAAKANPDGTVFMPGFHLFSCHILGLTRLQPIQQKPKTRLRQCPGGSSGH